MPRQKSAQPAYQFHFSGQAVVRLDSKDFYLGKHGTPESYAKYYNLLAQYNANGRQAPGDPEKPVEHLRDDAILVSHVTADYRNRVIPTTIKAPGRRKMLEKLCDLMNERFGDCEVDTFGPRKLESLREHFIEKDNCRNYVNEQVRCIIKIIEHGVARELVKPERIVALKALPALRMGQARENDPREAVPLDVVAKTLPGLLPVVQSMVRLQLLTAARPSEIFNMRPEQIDRSGKVWFLRPAQYKSSHHGKRRAIPLIAEAVAILQPYLFGDAGKPCFLNSNGKPFDRNQYRRSIVRACERLKLPSWSPYALRRTAGQAIRDELGAEHVQALLGHAKLSTTEIYAKATERRAIEAAKHAPHIAAV